MRFLVSVLLLTMFSASAIAHDDKKWIYLDCKSETGKWNLTLAINRTHKEKSSISISSGKITQDGSFENESFIYLGVKFEEYIFDGKREKDWQTSFKINRINGVLFVSHDDLRAGDLNGRVYAILQCNKGRMF